MDLEVVSYGEITAELLFHHAERVAEVFPLQRLGRGRTDRRAQQVGAAERALVGR